MPDHDLERSLREALGADADGLPLTITAAELERRVAVRRRARVGRWLSAAAAGIAVVLVGSLVAVSSGLVAGPEPGPGEASSVAQATESMPPEPTGTGQPPATPSPYPVPPDGPCDPLDVSTVDRPPEIVVEVAPPTGTSTQRTGLLGAFRLAGRDVGRLGSWDHDTIALEPAATGVLSGVTVLATNPDACLVGVTADAVPYASTPAATAATFVDSSTSEPERLAAFRAPPIGDWFVRVHVEFQTTDGSEAFSESFVRIVVAEPTIEPPEPNECEPVDPSQSPTPPTVITGSSPGDAMGFGGVVTGHAWNGARDGSPGSWEFPGEPEWIGIDPAVQTLVFVSDACMLGVSAEARLVRYASPPPESPRPIELAILQGGSSRVAHAAPPPTGGWLVRLRATFATTDGSEAWSETLFPVMGAFDAPSLTLRDDTGVAVTAPAGCPSYDLASGASAADQCGAAYEVNTAAMELAVASGRQVELALADGWLIDQARVVAVDAGMVRAGAFAPEHSVHFAETGGATVSFPVSLDRGRWIVRVSLNGHRGDDRFGASYDLAVEIR